VANGKGARNDAARVKNAGAGGAAYTQYRAPRTARMAPSVRVAAAATASSLAPIPFLFYESTLSHSDSVSVTLKIND